MDIEGIRTYLDHKDRAQQGQGDQEEAGFINNKQLETELKRLHKLTHSKTESKTSEAKLLSTTKDLMERQENRSTKSLTLTIGDSMTSQTLRGSGTNT